MAIRRKAESDSYENILEGIDGLIDDAKNGKIDKLDNDGDDDEIDFDPDDEDDN